MHEQLLQFLNKREKNRKPSIGKKSHDFFLGKKGATSIYLVVSKSNNTAKSPDWKKADSHHPQHPARFYIRAHLGGNVSVVYQIVVSIYFRRPSHVYDVMWNSTHEHTSAWIGNVKFVLAYTRCRLRTSHTCEFKISTQGHYNQYAAS